MRIALDIKWLAVELSNSMRKRREMLERTVESLNGVPASEWEVSSGEHAGIVENYNITKFKAGVNGNQVTLARSTGELLHPYSLQVRNSSGRVVDFKGGLLTRNGRAIRNAYKMVSKKVE